VVGWKAWLVGAALVACGGAPPAPPAAPVAEEPEEREPEEPVASGSLDAAERARPPSTASYDEALATPEALDVHDERAHLTDVQLSNPMRGVLSGCRVPSNARVTIKTAVQNGRAIGVTVSVRFERPKSAKRPPSSAVLKAQAKAAAKIGKCADRAVRVVVWPPSSRRDSFTTEM
jgi:hypothetical protein